jgi:hypothetical protein
LAYSALLVLWFIVSPAKAGAQFNFVSPAKAGAQSFDPGLRRDDGANYRAVTS